MRGVDISIKTNLKEIEKKLNAFAYQQIPFATALALNDLADQVKVAEQKNMRTVFDRPTPFTVNSVRVRRARKNDLVATVFVMDRAAKYLKPYEDGGVRQLNSKAVLTPYNVPLNQYGNLTKNKLAQLKARGDVFIGPVKFKDGRTINGVWQRNGVKRGGRRAGGYGTKGAHDKGLIKSGGPRTTLKLLIKFDDPKAVKQKLGYRETARSVVNRGFNKAFGKAMGGAIKTAR